MLIDLRKAASIVLMFFILVETLDGIAQNEIKFDSPCLEMLGVSSIENISIEGMNLKLYIENEEREMKEVRREIHNASDFKLQRDSNYTIEVSKSGYATRMISISTSLPKSSTSNPIYICDFELELIEDPKAAENQQLIFPLVLIDYDAIKDAVVEKGNDFINISCMDYVLKFRMILF